MARFSWFSALLALIVTTSPSQAQTLREWLAARRDRTATSETQPNPKATQRNAREFAYGPDRLQKLDFWPARAPNAPLVVFAHGGGWKRGDKSNATGRYMASHLAGLGYALASLNYRLVPAVRVEDQAADVALALAWLKANAKTLGVDPGRIVLMGHSAGAHLAALVGTDERYLRAAGLGFADLKGIIPLDGAAYDVPRQLADGHRIMQQTYAQAFGSDARRQQALSPTFQAAPPNAPAFLILHVDREDAKRQSAALASALRAAGTAVELHAIEGKGLRGHIAINRSLGDPAYPATPILDGWLSRAFAR